MITTHILDTSRGRPASGVAVRLESESGDGWTVIGTAVTNDDGRAAALVPDGVRLPPGTYRLTFEVGVYFNAHGVEAFYPRVHVVFLVVGTDRHYHVPLLISPYGYTTYRGS